MGPRGGATTVTDAGLVRKTVYLIPRNGRRYDARRTRGKWPTPTSCDGRSAARSGCENQVKADGRMARQPRTVEV